MKICSACDTTKPHSEFNRNKAKRDGLQTSCRPCTKVQQAASYRANRDRHKANVNARKRRVVQANRRRVWAFLLGESCVDCGYDDSVIALQFDHVRGVKIAAVSKLVSDGVSWASIEAEIAKCEVRCSNCHHIKTARTHRWIYEREEAPVVV